VHQLDKIKGLGNSRKHFKNGNNTKYKQSTVTFKPCARYEGIKTEYKFPPTWRFQESCVHLLIEKRLSPVPMMSLLNPAHNFLFHSFNIQVNVILPSTSMSYMWPFLHSRSGRLPHVTR